MADKCAGEHKYQILVDPEINKAIAFCTLCAKVIEVKAPSSIVKPNLVKE